MHYLRFFGFLLFGLVIPQLALAQTIIRDTEIEEYMTEWFSPILEAADGIDQNQVKIIIIQNPDINAFVAGGANIFFYTGLVQKTDHPGELIGVMAHELGHISGSHLIRSRDALENASYETIIGTILGVGAAILSGDGGAAGAVAAGSSSIAQRRYLANSRAFESSADQAAVSFMNAAAINPEGLVTFMEKLLQEELAPASRQSEYTRTHPLTEDRVSALEAAWSRSPYKDKALPAHWMDQHARMNAKLLSFITPEQVDWFYDTADKSIAAEYARTVAHYRQNRVDAAIKGIDGLIGRERDNPFFYELKGQMLVDFGRLREAIPPYEKALSMRPNSGLIRTALAHAQIETAGNNKERLNASLVNLKRALQNEPRSSRIHRLMATAYGRLGQDPQARLHLAEEALLQRKIPYAKQQAEMALKGLDENSSDWLRARDILSYLQQNKG